MRLQTKQGAERAGGALVLIIGTIVPFLCTLALSGMDYLLRWHVWNRVYDIRQLSLLDTAKHYQDGAGFLNTAAIICFAAVAGMLLRDVQSAHRQPAPPVTEKQP